MVMPEKVNIAIETSGRVGSVAVGRGDDVIEEVKFTGFMRHSQELFPTLEQLLHEVKSSPDKIGNVYITVGPGSFTGLRIAVTTAKMFGFSQNTNIVAVDAMDVIAENACQHTNENGESLDCITTVLDAKKGLFYAAVFDHIEGHWKKTFGTEVISSDNLKKWLLDNKKNRVGLLGEGLVYYADRFEAPFTHLLDKTYWHATAAGLYSVGQRMAKKQMFTDPHDLAPKYLRQPDALVKAR